MTNFDAMLWSALAIILGLAVYEAVEALRRWIER